MEINVDNNKIILDGNMSHLLKYRWKVNKLGYAGTCINGKYTFLHWLIIGKPKKGLVTDHINRNRLDNRKENLRHVTFSINCRNSSNNRILFVFNEYKSIVEWSEDCRCVVDAERIYNRLKKGWDAESAITIPVIKRKPFTKSEDTFILECLKMKFRIKDIAEFLERPVSGIKYRQEFFLKEGLISKRSKKNQKLCVVSKSKSKPTKEELRIMVWSKPCTELALELNVNDSTIKRWCDEFKIEKPSSKYWKNYFSEQNRKRFLDYVNNLKGKV